MPRKTVLQFVFDAEKMMAICQGKKKIVITSFLEEVRTKGGEPVGAMRVDAVGKGKAKAVSAKAVAKAPKSGAILYGCPIPPCSEE